MKEISPSSCKSFGSPMLDKIVTKLQSTEEPRKRYEYVLWLAKKLPILSEHEFSESIKVKGCISQVYVLGEINQGKLKWKGFSDALITKGLLSLLISGLDNLTPEQILNIDPVFIRETRLNSSLTPSRANGFMNIFLNMKAQAKNFQNNTPLLNKV
tara:strand:- start:13311 stop:13778 length:468 start_codon:yes stop_codon:yes gene_type:complete